METLKFLIVIFAGVSIVFSLAYNMLQLVKSYKLERKLQRQAEEEAKRLQKLEERVMVLEMTAIASMLYDFVMEVDTNDAEG